MHVAVPRESAPGERRVAAVPDVLPRLEAKGIDVTIEAGAGAGALFSDDDYVAAGATIAPDHGALFRRADVICKVQAPTVEEARHLPEGSALICLLQPASNLELVKVLVTRGIGAFSLDLLPRISRAQAMDALSSQATVTGYRGGLIAADRLPRFFPMFMTAAGTVPPAKVLVLGAGVAGLQAIATARRLGAVVRAYDVRPAARDEVRSLGASFVELELETQEGQGGYAREQSEEFLARQRELIGNEVAAADAVITTAAIPGRRAPLLVTAEMVGRMRPGSVIVDLAAESGGNCELAEPGKDVVANGVTVYGASNLASTMATHASFLYARNIAELLGLFAAEGGAFDPDFDDEIIAGTCVTFGGEVRHEPTRVLLEGGEK
ncbi:MAG TPA: Re/Si-specific NAD(P)(+) transhydrogenase subunit alpha [Acidimicrobiales bacterium]|nr:Re/Si-specific NAD(P)(+) transhydrogenase subunit alpha [Acidimicrobiales bacterium]